MLPSAKWPGGAGLQLVPARDKPVSSLSQAASHSSRPRAPTARLVPPTRVIHGSEPGYCSGVSSPKSPVAKLTVMPSTAARSSTVSQASIMLCGTGM